MKHDHGGIGLWSTKRYREHLAKQHGTMLRGGWAWMELQAKHDQLHQATSVRAPAAAPAADETADAVECAYDHCHHPVTWSGTGRRPKYHTANCRKRAEQDRRRSERLAAERKATAEAAEQLRRQRTEMAAQLAIVISQNPSNAAMAITDWLNEDLHNEHRRWGAVATLLDRIRHYGTPVGLPAELVPRERR